MDGKAGDGIKQEIEDEARKLFPGVVRRVEWLQYGDEPVIEPGELLPRFILAEPPGEGGSMGGQFQARAAIKVFQKEHGPALKRFRRELSGRWPEIRHIGVMFEDDSGHIRGGVMQALDGEPKPGTDDRQIAVSDDFTPVMVRLRAAELDIVDTLIRAGIAANRAEAVRWALTRISERPAFAELRERTREIERLKAEF
jgi:hypothetical protein